MRALTPGAALGALLLGAGVALVAYGTDGRSIQSGLALLLYGAVLVGATSVAAALTALVGLLRRFR